MKLRFIIALCLLGYSLTTDFNIALPSIDSWDDIVNSLQKVPGSITSLDINNAKDKGVKSNCKKAITHCCSGFCRGNDVIHPWAWSGFLESYGANRSATSASLFRMLQSLHRHDEQKLGPHKSDSKQLTCRLTFAGDSLMADQRNALICQMMELGYDVIKYSGRTGHWHAPRTIKYKTDLFTGKTTTPMQATFITLNKLSQSHVSSAKTAGGGSGIGIMPCPGGVELLKIPPLDILTYDEVSSYVGNSVVILNWEVHCNDEKCMMDTVQNVFHPLTKVLLRNNATIIWRSAEAQHFATSDGSGLFQHLKRAKGLPNGCMRSSNFNASRYRMNIVDKHYLSKYGRGVISTIPVFEWTYGAYYLHHPRDCTHYCYAPGRFQPMWEGISTAITK